MSDFERGQFKGKTSITMMIIDQLVCDAHINLLREIKERVDHEIELHKSAVNDGDIID